jgi:hypothetical protein
VTVVGRFVQAVSHGGLMKKPTLIVIHSAETPLAAGYAKSIAENWFGKSATTSAHFMVDPVETIRLLSDNVVSYAVGPNANGFTLNIEQAGYASLSRAQWTTPAGMAQHTRVGALVAELAKAHGIPLRWATDAQIKAAAGGVVGGVCFHNDIHRVLGGTTHTDPTPNYPGDLLMAAATTTTPVAPVQEDDDMTPAQAAQLDEVLARLQRIEPLVNQCAEILSVPIHSMVPGSTAQLTPRDMLAAVDNATYATQQVVAALAARPTS